MHLLIYSFLAVIKIKIYTNHRDKPGPGSADWNSVTLNFFGWNWVFPLGISILNTLIHLDYAD